MSHIFWMCLFCPFIMMVACRPVSVVPKSTSTFEPNDLASATQLEATSLATALVESQIEPPATVTAVSTRLLENNQVALHMIQLQSRIFIPEPGVETAVIALQKRTPTDQTFHALIQFAHIPTEQERNALENAGVALLAYVPTNTWFVAIPAALDLHSEPLVQASWIGMIQPVDRLNPELAALSWGRQTETQYLNVRFFADVPTSQAAQLLLDQGATISERIPDFNRFTIQIPNTKVAALAELDGVQWITAAAPPKTTGGNEP